MSHWSGSVLTRLLSNEKANTSGVESRRRYVAMHEPRLVKLPRLSHSLIPDSAARVFDIGRSELTAYLATFHRDIHTLGFDPQVDDGGHREVRDLSAILHITFDLLNSPNAADWPQCGTFDLIVSRK